MMITTTDKADFWREHQHNWLESGLSQKAYCQQHNLSYPAFTYWRARQKDTETGENRLPSIIPVRIEHGDQANNNQNEPAIEIHVGSVKVVLAQSVPVHYLRELVRALA